MAQQERKARSGIWSRPSKKWLLGIPLGGFVAFVLGAAALGTMNYVLHETGKNEFCYVCHSHEAFIRPEYEASSHFSNASGVRADCADCHLPHDNWFELVWTKAVVSLDIVPEMMGKLSTREKYEAQRATMAESVWRQFKADDSRFCRDCHEVDAMDVADQERRAARQHARAAENGQTCIECHYGIVHNLPEGAEDILDRVVEDFARDR